MISIKSRIPSLVKQYLKNYNCSYKPMEVSSNGDDLALIRLPRLATTFDEDPDENVAPVCLAWNEKAKLPTKQHVVMGWGR